MWSEFTENPFNLQNLYLGINITLIFLVCYFNQSITAFFDSCKKDNKRLKDYLIIITGILLVGLFLYCCGAYESNLGEGDSNPDQYHP